MKSNSKDAGYKRNASITLLALGQVFLKQRELRKAQTFLQQACNLSENLLGGDAENGETIADLALIYGNLSAALTSAGKFDESISNREKSLEFFKRCLAKNPEDMGLKRNFAEIEKQNMNIAVQTAKLQPIEKAKIYRGKTSLLSEKSRKITENLR